jgi:hypothetical protein
VVSGVDGEVDEVQQISVNSKAWSKRTGVSWSETKVWLERPRAEVASGHHPIRQLSAREGQEKDQGGAPGGEEEDRRGKEARNSPSTPELFGEACRRATLC